MNEEPTKVEVVSPVPIPVEVVNTVPTGTGSKGNIIEKRQQDQRIDPSVPAKTTYQEDLTHAGQRQINLIWETTQMRVALSVIWASLGVSATLAVFGKFLGTPDLQLAAVVFVFGVANLVTGFYFGRTNHSKTGGVGMDASSNTR